MSFWSFILQVPRDGPHNLIGLTIVNISMRYEVIGDGSMCRYKIALYQITNYIVENIILINIL